MHKRQQARIPARCKIIDSLDSETSPFSSQKVNEIRLVIPSAPTISRGKRVVMRLPRAGLRANVGVQDVWHIIQHVSAHANRVIVVCDGMAVLGR